MADIVDIIKTIYKELFTVKFLHSGYGFPRPGSISDSLNIHPDADTDIIFNNYSIGYSFFNDTLVVFMRCVDQSPSSPFTKFSGDVRLRFLINASSDFLNKTVVNAVEPNKYINFPTGLILGLAGL
jgi:hypothetical protein